MQDEIYMDMFQDDNEAQKDGKILASCPALTQSNESMEMGLFFCCLATAWPRKDRVQPWLNIAQLKPHADDQMIPLPA